MSESIAARRIMGEQRIATDRPTVCKAFLSREQIDQAICTLPEAGWVRLRKVAAAYCRGRSFDAGDLLHRAFTKVLDASRQCPADVDVVRFLAETMHSIASDDAKKRRRHPELQAVSLFGNVGGLALDPPDCRATAEQKLADDQEASRLKQAIIGLFADAPRAGDGGRRYGRDGG
jgi:hypothetical protein